MAHAFRLLRSGSRRPIASKSIQSDSPAAAGQLQPPPIAPPLNQRVWRCVEDISRLQKGARFIGVFASLSEQGGTPDQRAAKTLGFETPAERFNACIASTG